MHHTPYLSVSHAKSNSNTKGTCLRLLFFMTTPLSAPTCALVVLCHEPLFYGHSTLTVTELFLFVPVGLRPGFHVPTNVQFSVTLLFTHCEEGFGCFRTVTSPYYDAHSTQITSLHHIITDFLGSYIAIPTFESTRMSLVSLRTAFLFGLVAFAVVLYIEFRVKHSPTVIYKEWNCTIVDPCNTALFSLPSCNGVILRSALYLCD